MSNDTNLAHIRQTGASAPAGKQDLFTLAPSNLKEAMEYADLIAKSGMVPKDYQGKPGNVLVAVQMGAEIGLPPTQALQNIAVINGRPSLWGDALKAVVMSSPLCEYVKEWFDDQTQTAYCETKRRGHEPRTESFSQEDAKCAGLLGKQGPWTQYRKRMQAMRARGFCLRDEYPDVLKGIAIAEEAMDMTPMRDVTPPPQQQEEKPANKADALTQQLKGEQQAAPAPTPVPELLKHLPACTTEQDLQEWKDAALCHPDGSKEQAELVSAYKAHKTNLKHAADHQED